MRGWEEKGIHSFIVGGYVNDVSSVEFLQKIKIRLPHDSVTSLS